MIQAIKTTGLTKTYGEKRALDDVNLVVPEGSIFGFLGPNGAGKSTTFRVLLGLLRPDAGEATLLGGDPGEMLRVCTGAWLTSLAMSICGRA